jgi:hypothetical protein
MLLCGPPLTGFWFLIGIGAVIACLRVGRESKVYSVFWFLWMILGALSAFALAHACGFPVPPVFGKTVGPDNDLFGGMFTTLPATITSVLGLAIALPALWKPPLGPARKPGPMAAGIGMAILAVSLTLSGQTSRHRFRIVDRDGQPMPGVEVQVQTTDRVGVKTHVSRVSDADGTVTLRGWHTRYLVAKATAPECFESRATFGNTGWGGTGWQFSWEVASVCFPDGNSDPSRAELIIRRRDDLIVPAIRDRMLQSVIAASEHGSTTYIGGLLGQSFEGLEIMDSLAANARLAPDLSDFYSNQADLLAGCDRFLTQKSISGDTDNSRWRGLAKWAGVNGPPDAARVRQLRDHIKRVAGRLLDHARPLLGIERSSANAYDALLPLLPERKADLAYALPRATPRASNMILHTMQKRFTRFDELEPLIHQAAPLVGLRLLRMVEKWQNQTEWERGNELFRQIDSRPHPKPEPEAPFDYVTREYELTRSFLTDSWKPETGP